MSSETNAVDELPEAKRELKPKLRFAGFSDEWLVHKIGDFIESYKGGASLTPSDFASFSVCEVIPKKAITHGTWLKMDLEKPTYCNEDFFNENMQSVVDSSYLITTLRDLVPSGPNIGYIVKYLSNKKYLLAQGVYGLKPKKTIVADFLICFSNTDRYRKMMKTAMVGSTQVHIRNSVYLGLPISVPSLGEQQKIADCLTSVDELITAQSQKLEALETHKKGLMQQLFPAEGKTVPNLRFPEFQDALEWKNTSLGEISTITSGGTPSRSRQDYWNGKIPWVTTTLIDFNTIETANEYITEAGLKESSTKIFPKDTILMAMYGQGKTRGKVAILGIEAAINQACAAVLLQKNINTKFAFQNLAGRYDEIRELSNQGGQENLSGGLIERIPFTYPDIDEQEKIADCLCSIDELIAAQKQKLESLKTHKRGLMQQLFPSPDGAKE
jgi:type I restriction enzyme, S subunit